MTATVSGSGREAQIGPLLCERSGAGGCCFRGKCREDALPREAFFASPSSRFLYGPPPVRPFSFSALARLCTNVLCCSKLKVPI